MRSAPKSQRIVWSSFSPGSAQPVVRIPFGRGQYSPGLAMIGPAALVLAAYYALNPDDPWEIPKPFPLRLGLAIFLAIAAGLANWYVTENGLYWLLFGPR